MSAKHLISSAALGVLMHQGVFKHGEWHLQAPSILVCHVVAVASLTAAIITYDSAHTYQKLLLVTELCAAYSGSLFASIILYRIFFSPLRSFPGPTPAKISKLWHAYKCRDAKNYLLLDDLHDKYGDFVRTGPNELAIFDPEVHQAIDGLGSKFRKANWYDNLWPDLSVVSCRDRSVHDARRRIWDRGFGSRAVAEYENVTLKYVEQLEKLVASAASDGKVVNGSDVFYWFGWDVMGEVIFSKQFRMLEDQEWHIVTVMLRRAMNLLGPATPVPWLAHIGFKFFYNFGTTYDWFKMQAFCHQSMYDRVAMQEDRKDVFSPLIAEAKKNGMTDLDHRWLKGDAVLAILAGSDTAAATLVFIFYRLAQDPRRAETLYQEIADADIKDPKALQSLPYLNAIINETLRLHPVLATGGLRESPKEGAVICGKVIPGNTTIIAPRWTTGKLESCYTNAKEFIPERWFSKPDMIKDSRTFVPFGTGRFNCIGKQLGLSELRLATSALMKRFHVSFAPGTDGDAVIRDLRDTFTPSPGRLDLVFKER